MFNTHGYGKAHQEQLLQEAHTEIPQEKPSTKTTVGWRLVLAGATMVTVVGILVFAAFFLFPGI